MYTQTFVSLIALATSALAISVTSPASESSWDVSSDIPVTWTSVSTDPPTINIELVNFASYPTVTKTLASNVATSDDSYTIKAGTLSGITGVAFQINLMSTSPEDTGIEAQSQQFNLTSSSSTSSSSSSSSSTSSTSSTTLSTASTTIVLPPTSTPIFVNSTTAASGTTSTGTGSVTTGTSSPSPSPFSGDANGMRVGGGAILAGALAVAAFFA